MNVLKLSGIKKPACKYGRPLPLLYAICAMPCPNDQFSPGISVSMIMTSSAVTGVLSAILPAMEWYSAFFISTVRPPLAVISVHHVGRMGNAHIAFGVQQVGVSCFLYYLEVIVCQGC